MIIQDLYALRKGLFFLANTHVMLNLGSDGFKRVSEQLCCEGGQHQVRNDNYFEEWHMKLDPIFTVKNKKLYKIADNSEVDTSTLKRIDIPWSTVELEPEAYNEEYLAALREQLKAMETSESFAVLVPVVDKPLETPEDEELFINAYNHTARRVKDCTSVAGLELVPQLKDKQAFMDTLSIKHAQYIYFTKAENPLSDDIVVY